MPRRASVVLLCVLVNLVAAASAPAGDSAVVSRSWVSGGASAPAVAVVRPGRVARVYANFVWARAPRPGQVLRIQWIDPDGAVQAVWSGRTLASDHAGDRLYSWIGAGMLAGRPGTWRATLTIAGTERSTRPFRVAAPA